MPIQAGNKQDQSSPAEADKNTKQLDKEIREMVSAITNRVTSIHKLGSGHRLEDEDDDDQRGVRIVTLAGTNSGAILRGELDEKSSQRNLAADEEEEEEEEEPDALSTYVNSNFQALNNSIMLGGSYDAHDPGVHVDIADLADQIGYQKAAQRRGRKGKKTEKKKEEKEDEKEFTTDEHHSSHSD